MEKRIKKIQKWLDRCIEACKARSWDNALADMECANAELQGAREQLWKELEESHARKRKRRILAWPTWLRTSIVAVIVLMAGAVPLSVNEGVMKGHTGGSGEDLVLEWVDRDEKRLLAALRESLSENSFREVQRVQEKEGQGVADREDERSTRAEALPEKDGRASNFERVSPERKESSGTSGEERNISVEEVIALVQIGERSLRDQGSVIEIRK